jgi:hypothetical protein
MDELAIALAQHQEAAQQKFGLPRFAPLTVSAVQRVCARVVADANPFKLPPPPYY